MSEPLVPVFDLGGVFVDWNPMYLFRKLFDSEGQLAVDAHAFMRASWSSRSS